MSILRNNHPLFPFMGFVSVGTYSLAAIPKIITHQVSMESSRFQAKTQLIVIIIRMLLLLQYPGFILANRFGIGEDSSIVFCRQIRALPTTTDRHEDCRFFRGGDGLDDPFFPGFAGAKSIRFQGQVRLAAQGRMAIAPKSRTATANVHNRRMLDGGSESLMWT